MTLAAMRAALVRGVSSFRREAAQTAHVRQERLDEVWGFPGWVFLVAFLVLGLFVRLFYFQRTEGLYHPDEIFQYLEPAHFLLEGHGVLAWEFQQGARNWLLPWHYASVLELARSFGLEGLPRLNFVRLHNVVCSLLVVPAAYRMGRALSGRREASVLAAAGTALLPLLGFFACRTLAECHSLVFSSFAYALWFEQRAEAPRAGGVRRALCVGLLFGAAVIARPNYVVVLPVILADYALGRRVRELAGISVGFALALTVLGVSDFVTWGFPFQSLITWFGYNIIEGKTSTASNLKPYYYYFASTFHQGFGPALYPILLAMLVSMRTVHRGILGWLTPVVVFSAISNKQERFLLPIWPCFVAAAAASLVHVEGLIARLAPRLARGAGRRVLSGALPVLALVALLAGNFAAVAGFPSKGSGDLFRAQDWVRRQADLSGLAIGARWFRSGGYTVTDRALPITFFERNVPTGAIFSHAIATSKREIRAIERSKQWTRIRKFGDVRVYRRK